jgi:rubrerythrin
MTIHDLPRDEFRRQLRDIDRDNTEAMPGWRAALARLIGGDESTADEKAAVLGVPSPSRRSLFKIGGASILGAAVLASGGLPVAAAGRQRPASTPPGSDAPAGEMGPEMDLVLARTAASLEKLAIDTYGAAAGLLTVQAVIDAATMFADHHQQHLDALNAVITGAGATAVTEPNAAVFDALIKPAVDAAVAESDPLKAEAAAVTLAITLEEAATQTYCFAAGALSDPALRSTIMTIGGVEARHAATLRLAGFGQAPDEVFVGGRSFFPGTNPLAGIDGALITS